MSCRNVKIKNENGLSINKQIASVVPAENKMNQNEFVKVFTFTLAMIY